MKHIKTITRKEIQESLGIERTKFVNDVQPHLTRYPSTGLTAIYDYNDFVQFKKTFKKKKPGRKSMCTEYQ